MYHKDSILYIHIYIGAYRHTHTHTTTTNTVGRVSPTAEVTAEGDLRKTHPPGSSSWGRSSTHSTTGVGWVMMTLSGGSRNPGTSGGVWGGGVVRGDAPDTPWNVNTCCQSGWVGG